MGGQCCGQRNYDIHLDENKQRFDNNSPKANNNQIKTNNSENDHKMSDDLKENITSQFNRFDDSEHKSIQKSNKKIVRPLNNRPILEDNTNSKINKQKPDPNQALALKYESNRENKKIEKLHTQDFSKPKKNKKFEGVKSKYLDWKNTNSSSKPSLLFKNPEDKKSMDKLIKLDTVKNNEDTKKNKMTPKLQHKIVKRQSSREVPQVINIKGIGDIANQQSTPRNSNKQPQKVTPRQLAQVKTVKKIKKTITENENSKPDELNEDLKPVFVLPDNSNFDSKNAPIQDNSELVDELKELRNTVDVGLLAEDKQKSELLNPEYFITSGRGIRLTMDEVSKTPERIDMRKQNKIERFSNEDNHNILDKRSSTPNYICNKAPILSEDSNESIPFVSAIYLNQSYLL